MVCKFDKDLLQEYLEGTIDPLEKIFLEEHLRTCRECRAELTRLKLLFYELENIDDRDIEIPLEMESIRNNALDSMFEKKEKYGVKEFIEQQRQVLTASSSFIKYIPGKQIAKKGFELNKSMTRTAGKGLKYLLGRNGLKRQALNNI